MTNRMYLVNKRTGHVCRIASFRWEGGWFASKEKLERRLDKAFAVAQQDGNFREDEWEVGLEDHPLVQKYLVERHPLGIRN